VTVGGEVLVGTGGGLATFAPALVDDELAAAPLKAVTLHVSVWPRSPTWTT
jgi:hypothetical protein